LLLHNACPRAAAHTLDTLHALEFEVLKHPPFSLELAPSDCHLFGPIKEYLRGQKFADDEVMEAVQSWLKATPKTFLLEGIRGLWTGGTSVLRSRGTMSKNETQTISVNTLVKKVVIKTFYLMTYLHNSDNGSLKQYSQC
jgi:hypothetical protein